MKNKKKCEDGGVLPSLLGTGLSAINPLLGQVAMPLVQAMLNKNNQTQVLQDHFNQVQTSTNPYQLEKGGTIGYEDLIKYDGASHANGGIDVGQTGLPSPVPVANVEDKEVAFKVGNKTYIFSTKLKI